MRLDSAQDLKLELKAEFEAAHVEHFISGDEPRAPVGLGISNPSREMNTFQLAVRTTSEEEARRIEERAPGEVDVKIIHVKKRLTADYLRGKVRPLEPGVEISPKGSNWVGTLTCFVQGRSGALYGVTNAHVGSDMGSLRKGTEILQPFGGEAIGVLDETVPTTQKHNLVDECLVRLRRVKILPGYHGVTGSLHGITGVTPDMIGTHVVKAGRTTGGTVGVITAVDIDNLSIDYGNGRFLSYDNQIEITGARSADFSAGGDSGSLILNSHGWPVALLFAGGSDQSGQDFTYANRIDDALDALSKFGDAPYRLLVAA